ncbi:MAG: apolipoprotein N-acyltransferase [Acidobacteriota bacterium]|nr:apolipoprotein N-acyltransferase [Acidobacteriota bacterium]
MNLGLSLASALLLILLFPGFNLTWLAPLALTPILIACARERSWKHRWFYGWAAGLVFWCGVCPWIEFVMEAHGGMGRAGGWGTFLLFGLYKGLHMAVFATLAGFLMPRWYAIPAVAALWTGIERTHGFFGFAWLDLGNAGIDMPLPMRLAPITGVYGLSFVFAMLACAVALIFVRRPRREFLWLAALLVLLLLPRAPRPATPSRRALLVQPNIDTEMQWTEDNLRDLEQRMALLSRTSSADLILWPEVPAPFYLNEAPLRVDTARVAQSAQTPLLFGAVGVTPQKEPLNSAEMLDSSGKVIDRYDKINLVPFGEFIPPLFGWVNKITKEIGDFVPGDRVVIFPVGDHKLGAFICYESAFPDLVRQFTHSGAEVLVNLSNDGYFGNSAAHAQHLEIARMRAAENRRWILRATNDGISASIDPRGRVRQRMAPFTQSAAMMSFDYETAQTPYTRYGDWFGWACFASGFLMSAVSQAHRRP